VKRRLTGLVIALVHLGCMPSIVESFVEAGPIRDLDVSCAATRVPPPPFTVSP
jgi:hypothetical protein